MLDAYAERWALVTGASSGIGAEFARQLAARGMHLILTARRESQLKELAEELHTRHGTQTEVIPADLSQSEDVTRLISEIGGRGIAVELLVNNAGFGVVSEAKRTDAESVNALVRLNIEAVTRLTYAFLGPMLERQHGAVINVSSVAAFQPVAYMPAYAASKAYVLHFSESLWVEARDLGVTVMALCPGTTRTEFFEAAGVSNWLKKRTSQSPEQVVRAGLKALKKRKHYCVPGWVNYLRSLAVRLAPRKMVVKKTMDYFRPQPDTDLPLPSEETNGDEPPQVRRTG